MRSTLILGALLALTACASWVDGTRSSIRSWCENNPDWCDVNAVK